MGNSDGRQENKHGQFILVIGLRGWGCDDRECARSSFLASLMPSLRARLEAVLAKYHFVKIIPGAIIPVEDVYKAQAIRIYRPQMIDDLLACLPQPSRDALEKLFLRHAHRYPSAIAWENALKDDLMIWATTTTEPTPTWCQHIRWNGTHWQCGDFWLSQPDRFGWMVCPICATPKSPEA